MTKTIKYITAISLLLGYSLLGLVSSSAQVINSMSGPVTIDKDTEYEYTVSSDDTSIVEPGNKVPSGYVQDESYLPSFAKVVYEGLSHFTGVSINSVKKRSDGDYTALISATNYASYEYSKVVESVDEVPRDYHVFLVIVGIDGVIKKSLNITDPTMTVHNGTGAFKNTLKDDTYAASYPFLYDDGANYLVAYQGIKYNDASGDFAYNNVFKVNYDFTSFDSYLINALPGSSEVVDGETLVKPTRFIVPYYNYVDSEGYKIINTVAISDRMWGENTNMFKLSSVQLTDITTNQTKSSQTDFQVLKWDETLSVKEADLPYSTRRIQELYEIKNSTDTFGIVSYDAINSSGDRFGKDILTIWDSTGKTKYSYDLGENGFHRIQKDISNENEIYFLHNEYLKKINLRTGSVTENILQLPKNGNSYSNIYIEFANPNLFDESFNVEYNFYGNVIDASGIFSAYGKSGGTVVGSMSDDFSIVNATIIKAKPSVSMNLLTSDDGSIFTYGYTRGNTTFFNEPSSTTNSISGNGFIDKTSSTVTNRDTFDTYMGGSKIIDDYAPAIKFDKVETINKDVVSTQEEWDELLTAGVLVYDTIDLDSNTFGNEALTESEMMDNLRSTINRNPNKMTLPIDWMALGVNKDEVGHYDVKYFVTDKSGQTSVTSGSVNIISNNTVSSDDESLFIDAKGFTVALSEVSSLTQDLVKQLEYANLKVWDTEYISSSLVSVNANELSKINNATTTGLYKLTFSYSKDNKTVNKTINVYVTSDDYHDGVDTDHVIVADNFILRLEDAASYTADYALVKSGATAYRVYDGYIYDPITLNADVKNVNTATKVGIYPVELKFSNPENNNNGEHFKLTDKVGAFVINEHSVVSDNMLLSANSFIVDLSTVSSALSNNNILSLISSNSNLVAEEFNPATKDVTKFSIDDLNVSHSIKAVEGSYKVSFKLNSSQELTKDITVYVVDTLSNKTNVIGANDIVISTSQARSFSSNDYINESSVVAINKESNAVVNSTLIKASYSSVIPAYGVYPLNFEYSNTDVDVDAYVFDSVSSKDITIGANNIYMSVNDVRTYNNSKYISNTNATLFNNNNDIIDNAKFSVNKKNVLAIPGTYNLSFTSNSNTVSVKAFVFDDVNVNGNTIFAGNNMYLSSSEVSKYLNDPSKLIGLGNVISIDISNNEENSINKINPGRLSSNFGTYDIKYTDAKGNVLTLELTVGNNLSINNGVAIAGNNVMYTVDEIENFESDRTLFNSDLINRSSARAWYINTNTDIGVVVDSLAVHIGSTSTENYDSYINESFYTRESFIRPQLQDLIQSDNTVINEELGYAIAAEPFGISSKQIKKLTQEDYIKLAEARAFDINESSLNEIKSLKVDYSNIKEDEGSYEIIYSLDMDGKTVVETAVTMYVGEGRIPEVISSENTVIYASNYEVSDKEIGNLTEYDHIHRANAYIVDMSTNEVQNNLFVDYSNVRNDDGVYAVYFGKSKSLVSAVKVTVTSNHSLQLWISIISYLLIAIMISTFIIRYYRRKMK